MSKISKSLQRMVGLDLPHEVEFGQGYKSVPNASNGSGCMFCNNFSHFFHFCRISPNSTSQSPNLLNFLSFSSVRHLWLSSRFSLSQLHRHPLLPESSLTGINLCSGFLHCLRSLPSPSSFLFLLSSLLSTPPFPHHRPPPLLSSLPLPHHRTNPSLSLPFFLFLPLFEVIHIPLCPVLSFPFLPLFLFFFLFLFLSLHFFYCFFFALLTKICRKFPKENFLAKSSGSLASLQWHNNQGRGHDFSVSRLRFVFSNKSRLILQNPCLPFVFLF